MVKDASKGVSAVFAILTLIASMSLVAGCATTRPDKPKKLTSAEKARLFVEMANSSIMEGDPTSALESLVNAEAEDPKVPEIYHSRALAYYAKKDPEMALASVRKAVALKPDFSQANSTLGKLLLDAGRFDEAEKYLLMAAKDPFNREAYKADSALGILFFRKRQTSQALAHLNRAIDAAPQIACVAYHFRGQLLTETGQLEKAVRDFERATQKICANYQEAQLPLGIAYERVKRYDMARKKFLEIQTRFPDTQMAEQAMNRLRYLP